MNANHEAWKAKVAHREAAKRIEVEELTVEEILITTTTEPQFTTRHQRGSDQQ